MGEDEGRQQAGRKGELQIYRRTRSRSRALEEEKKAEHKNLAAIAGRSVKKGHSSSMRMAKSIQKVIIDLTGDVSGYQIVGVP